MSARILVLPVDRRRIHAPTAPVHPVAGCSEPAFGPAAAERLQFWRGQSGRSYVHTIYPLLECPPLPPANYVLVRRDARHRPEVVHIGRVTNAAPTLNLAEIRHLAAGLGAAEVHVHLLAGAPLDAVAVERDLASVCLPNRGAEATGQLSRKSSRSA